MWARIGRNKVTASQLGKMELFLLKALDFNMTVTKEDLNTCLNQNFSFGQPGEGLQVPSPSPPPSSPRRWFQFLEFT